MTHDWGISCEIALIWMSLNFTEDHSTLVQVMAWCRQATSHYLSQCWPRSLSPCGVTRPQWVNVGYSIPLLAGSVEKLWRSVQGAPSHVLRHPHLCRLVLDMLLHQPGPLHNSNVLAHVLLKLISLAKHSANTAATLYQQVRVEKLWISEFYKLKKF